MKEGLTEIILIADRSGSMSGTIDEARGSINRLIEEQKAKPGEAIFTFVMFDDQYDLVKDRVNLKEIKKTRVIGNEYYARGMTAMNDAIGKTINSIGAKLAATAEEERPSKVILAIITDGMENASKEFTREQIAEMIKIQQETYNWEVIFLGADINVAKEAASMNVLASNSINYDNTDVGVCSAYCNLSDKIASIRNN